MVGVTVEVGVEIVDVRARDSAQNRGREAPLARVGAAPDGRLAEPSRNEALEPRPPQETRVPALCMSDIDVGA